MANPIVRAFVVMAVLAGPLVTTSQLRVESAEAMQQVQTLEVWGISGGVVSNPKQWKFRQSTTAANDLGSASAADPALDDSTWATRTLRWLEYPGPNVANHFRKDFDLNEIGVSLAQIQGIKVQLQYDDTAVMYLNGVEVYRSIRGNLYPSFVTHPPGFDFPRNPYIPWGGAEEFYVRIPDPTGQNTCEYSGPACPTSPYGGPNPPAVPVSLLNPGVNTWSITTWNQTGGGSGDSSLNHVFQLEIIDDPAPVKINEVVASNNNDWHVQLDGDPQLETPDWFELVNTSSSPVDMAGWTVSDSAASWVFPSVVIPAGGYLTVAASDNDRTDTTPLQTNFKLSAVGDTLKLTNPAGIVADDYGVLTEQFADTSYGRPGNTGALTYLDDTTRDAVNSAAGTDYAPVLRFFPNRIYNAGEPVSHQVDAFDPDGDPLTWSLTPKPPGLDIDANGVVSGTATTTPGFVSTIRVTDGDSRTASQSALWIVAPPPTGSPPLVLNEYNAVADDRELLGGSVVGNGGDWYEFVVVEDEVDLRGYTIELYDMKGPDGQLRLASTVTFASRIELGAVPAGTIITIGEQLTTDVSFDAVTDWNIHLQIDNTGNGAWFAPEGAGSVFNSTRDNQTVLVKDAAGVVVTPLSGETEAWDAANGGVSGAEVMNLCINPAAPMTLNPVTAYRDNGAVSTFGQPNVCHYPDPADPTQTIVFNQDLSGLRASANLGANSGDVNCDLALSVADALMVAQYTVGTRNDSGPCFFDAGGPSFDFHAAAADINQDSQVNVADALIIARCSVGIASVWCPA